MLYSWWLVKHAVEVDIGVLLQFLCAFCPFSQVLAHLDVALVLIQLRTALRSRLATLRLEIRHHREVRLPGQVVNLVIIKGMAKPMRCSVL